MSVRLAATLTLMLGVSALALPASSFAQEVVPVAASETDSAIIDYEAGFFNEFAPVTALDMVNRLPGFSLDNGNTQRRGLADAFGNLLINGARPSDKSIGLGTVLSRIPADQVLSIQLIRELIGGDKSVAPDCLALTLLGAFASMAQ